MNFCPECETYLITKINSLENIEDPNKLLTYVCNNCGYSKTVNIKEEPEHKYIYGSKFDTKRMKLDPQIYQYLQYDPTLPHVNNINCPNIDCPTKKTPDTTKSDVLYIRLNESDLTFLYQC